MMIKLSFLTILFSYNSFGHGMNSLGPNKGYIKMPANYHTELVEHNTTFNVYLLDSNFKNPTTYRSSVIMFFNKSTSANICKPNKLYFTCPKIKNIKSIQIKTVKNGLEGSIANYEYPLKIK